ncbi:MAG: hypothetical protein ABIK99_03095 [candidate division WOR-3 bacterium]
MKNNFLPESVMKKYEVEKILSQSHFATVYLALHKPLQRRVIIKVISPQIAQDETALKRFVREAKILSELDDPG